GLGDRLDHQPSELSGGQQQRVAIARALVTQPRLLLADEPTGNLDSRTSVEVMELFQELNAQGITILIVTHEPDVAQYATRIVEVAIGNGAQARIQEQINSLGTNVIMIMPGSTQQGGASQGAGTFNRLTVDDADKVKREATTLAAVSPVIQTRTQVIGGNGNW